MLSTSSLLALGAVGLSLGALVAAEDPLYPRTNDTLTAETHNQCDKLNCWKTTTTTCTEWYCKPDCGYGHTSTVYTTIYSTIITTTSVYEEDTITRTLTDYEPTTIIDKSIITEEITTTDYETTTILSSFPYTITVSKCSFTPAPTEEPYPTYIGKRAESDTYEPDTHDDGDCVISTTTLWSTVTQTTIIPTIIPTTIPFPTTITKETTYIEISTVTYTTEIPTTIISDHTLTKTLYNTSVVTSEVTLTKSYTQTATKTDLETVTDTEVVISTELVPTTFYSTITESTSYPVTITNGYTSYTTETTVVISTYTTYILVTNSYTVTQTLPPETVPGPTVSLPGELTTVEGPTVTRTLPPETVTGPTLTLPGELITITYTSTLSLSGRLTTIISTTTFISTAPGSLTYITLPPSTIVIPGSTSIETITSTVPPITTTFTQLGTTFTTQLPASTLTATRTLTLPPVTLSPSPQTIILTTTVPASITTCAAPTNTPDSNPPVFDPTSDLTWGCEPGYVCNPPKPDDCNVWADSPDDNYVCKPQFCVPAPWFPLIKWPENETSYYPPTEGYFNLNPNAFGLSYDIFEEEVIIEKVDGKLTSVITGNWASQTSLTHFPPESTATPTPYSKVKRTKQSSPHLIFKRDESVVPAVCYDTCNDAYLEAQQMGKTKALCDDGSAFRNAYDGCDACITSNEPQQKLSTKVYLETKFSQFLGYCDSIAAVPQTTPSSTAEAQVTTTPNVQTTSQEAPNTSSEPVPISTSSAEPPPPPTSTEIVSEPSSVGSPTPESSTPETTSGPEPTETTPIPSESTATGTITSLSSSTSTTTPGPSSVTTAGAQASRRSSYAGLIVPLLACIFFI